jgi:hypothetical protein
MNNGLKAHARQRPPTKAVAKEKDSNAPEA